METKRRTFLMLAVSGAIVLSTCGMAVADEAGGEVVRVTLDVQGMH